MQPIRELAHAFTASNGFDGQCTVRIYAPTAASLDLPVVILSQSAEDMGPSITNNIEQLAAEVLARYLGERDGTIPPFILVEHYPDRQMRGKAAHWHDPMFGESYDLVTFSTWAPSYKLGRDTTRWLATFGTPDWRHAERDEIERLIGGRLEWPACTCQHNSFSRIAESPDWASGG